MAQNEGVPKVDTAIVQSIFPDLCWTGPGQSGSLVPYNILAKFDLSVDTDITVLLNGFEAFTMFSRVTKVIGDEGGTGGGIFSKVNNGYCRPISHSSSVRAGGEFIIYHSSIFWMNCDGPEGTPNTVGRVIYVKVQSFVWLDENADFLGTPFVDSEGVDYSRFDTALQYIYDEMIVNSYEVQSINELNHPSSWDRFLWGGLTLKGDAYVQWFLKVRPGGVWDHKHTLDEMLHLGSNPEVAREQDPNEKEKKKDYYFPLRGDTVHEYYYDIWSNIHFGYVGSAAGFSAEELQSGAAVPVLAGRNDEADVLSTQIGIDLWNKYGESLTKGQLDEAIRANMSAYILLARAMRARGENGVVIHARNRK